MSVLTPLPEWSASIDSHINVDYSNLKQVAAKVLTLSQEERDKLIQEYSDTFCAHKFNLSKASAIYLLFRVLFMLPKSVSKTEAKNFGGWLHPSIQDGKKDFDLSWPVSWNEPGTEAKIDRFPGYFGGNYDAMGEFQFLKSHYKFRNSDAIRDIVFK